MCLLCREIGDKASYMGSHTVMKSKQPEVCFLACAVLSLGQLSC